jgi:GNAT superfamily N-acetyltransferase
MAARKRITFENLVVRKLDGPPDPGFDCGHEEQNSFFYQHAWKDQQQLLSVTYLYYTEETLAAFATLTLDGVSLSFRERGVHIRYETVGALKLGQLGVDLRFQGRGLGEEIVFEVVSQARRFASDAGCRYVTLDARPGLDGWYERRGFKQNRLMQERRIRFALEKQRDPDLLAMSMRFDIGEV